MFLHYKSIYFLVYRKKTFLRRWTCVGRWLSCIILLKLACWWNSCRIEICLLIFLNKMCQSALSLFFHNKSAVFSLILRIFSSTLLAFISICMSERVVFVRRRYRYSFLRVFAGSTVVAFVTASYSSSDISVVRDWLVLVRNSTPAINMASANISSINSLAWLYMGFAIKFMSKCIVMALSRHFFHVFEVTRFNKSRGVVLRR